MRLARVTRHWEEVWGADPSVTSHTGPVTVFDAEVNVVLSSRHWLSGA